jgi:hypothetical protein
MVIQALQIHTAAMLFCILVEHTNRKEMLVHARKIISEP